MKEDDLKETGWGILKDWSGERGVKLSRLAMDRDDWKKTVFNWVHPRPLRLRT